MQMQLGATVTSLGTMRPSVSRRAALPLLAERPIRPAHARSESGSTKRPASTTGVRPLGAPSTSNGGLKPPPHAGPSAIVSAGLATCSPTLPCRKLWRAASLEAEKICQMPMSIWHATWDESTTG